MNKDVIYIDVDDDVTAIIGKIKKSEEKIVALVPPKRPGALQSAVNLRLLERMAKNEKKNLVLITHNPALVALAANAKIPVAKNLQSRPEVAEIPAIIVDGGDDIIDGADLPIGDHASTVKVKDGTQPVSKGSRSDAIDSTDLEIDGEEVAAAAAGAAKVAPKKAKNRPKIPNFDSFRKKLFIGIGAGVALVALLIWMFVFAPAARVIITASTEPQSVSSAVKLGGTEATNFEKGVLSSIMQERAEEVTVEFTATGEKDVGEKATGTMRLTRTSVSSNPITVPAGTSFSSGSLTFVSSESATLGGTTIGSDGIVQSTATVAVVAANPGEEYNVSARSYQSSMSGYSSAGSAMSGGTTQISKVVSAEDVERAMGELQGKSTEEEQKALEGQFKNGEIVVDGSFTATRGDAVSAPAVDEAAPDGKAVLTVPTTYTIYAVEKEELDKYLKASINSRIDTDTQKIYSTGIDEAALSNFRTNEDGSSYASVNSTGAVGPVINEDEIKEAVKGQKYGEVQQELQNIDGIKEVDVQFSYFWVRTIPNNTDKIAIEFKVDGE